MSFIYSPPAVIPPQIENIVFVVATADNDAAVKTGIPGILSMPYTLTISSIRMDIDTAPTGSNLIVDMNWNGSTAMVNRFTIEATEFSTTTAATAPSLISNTLAVGTKVTFDIDQVGATVKGRFIQVTLTGVRS
jgi:hypothetical protein